MEAMIKQLAREEQEQFQKIKDHAAYDQPTLELCLQYYLSYRSSSHISHDKLGLAMKCAYFMAEKSQYTYNLNGQKIRGIFSFSLNRLLKDYKLDDTMMLLKDFSKKVMITDQQAASDLSNIIKEISFLFTFYSKFQKTIQKLDFKEKNNELNGYLKTFTSFSWLLYVEAKNQVLNRSLETISNTCLLAHVLCVMIIYGWEYLKPQALMVGEKKLTLDSPINELKKVVKQRIWEIFCIKSLQAYKQVASKFENFFNDLLEKGIIKNSYDKCDFLSTQRINNNYLKLDKYYQNNFNPQNLDERVFFRDRTINLTPSKFTPFAKQGHNFINKTQKIGSKHAPHTNKENTFNSHRILNYDAIERQMETCKNVPVKDIKLPKTIMQSPSMVKVPLICSTPVTASMEMFNYLNEKSKKIKDIPIQNYSFDKQACSLVEHALGQKDKKIQDVKKNMIIGLYKVLSYEYSTQNEQDQQILRAHLCLCIELVFFVSNINKTFQEIIDHVGAQPYHLWRVVDQFHKTSKNIPVNLKYHLLELETQIISVQIWKKNDIIRMMNQIASAFGQDYEQGYEKLFRRVLHQVGFRISQLCSLLNVNDDVGEKIFETMKETLLAHEHLLKMRNIDQLIMCAIYSNCFKAGSKRTFNAIKEVYQEANPNLKSTIQALFCTVHTEQKPVNIIEFYNNYYLRTQGLKVFIHRLHDEEIVSKGKKNSLLMSPLKEIIPRDINFKQKSKAAKGAMTPQTQLLYAYNESPLLKNNLQSFKPKANLKSKRVLDFDLEETVTRKPEPQEFQPDYQAQKQQVNDFLSKKILKKGIQIKERMSPYDHYAYNSHSPIANMHTPSINQLNPMFKLKQHYKKMQG